MLHAFGGFAFAAMVVMWWGLVTRRGHVFHAGALTATGFLLLLVAAALMGVRS